MSQLHDAECPYCGEPCMLGDLDVNERCPTCSEAYAESLIDEADDICPNCNGSGEGMYEGQRCWQCKGKGTA